MSEALHGMIVSSGATACGLVPCSPGTCMHPDRRCGGNIKVPVHPPVVAPSNEDVGVPGMDEPGFCQHD